MKALFLLRIAAVALCTALTGAAASADVNGMVFQSKGGESPLLVWDATPAVVDIVNAKQPRDAALHSLEVSAFGLLADRLPTLKGAKHLTVRVIYQKTGAVSPQYGGPTSQGLERFFELSVDADAIQADRQSISQALGAGTAAPQVHVVILGALPPL
jgi:hypothetical protein